MLTLRDLARTDTAIGSITNEECKFIASVLDFALILTQGWLLKYFIPKAIRDRALSMRMLAATLNRTPEERQPLNEQIRLAMERERRK